jgi:hypothetical protein
MRTWFVPPLVVPALIRLGTAVLIAVRAIQ